jgi:hypothetical protein
MNRRQFLKLLGSQGAYTAAVAAATLSPSFWDRFLGLFRSKESKAKRLRDKKARIIAEYLKTSEGRSRLASMMIQPLRARRDYESIGRKCFIVEQLPDEALATKRPSRLL